ncbi:MAG: hypothetical protein NC305_15955 [Lachnospiraceae bacterium]|nr:hypothetical protein [Lachnospiraceae bacterium]
MKKVGYGKVRLSRMGYEDYVQGDWTDSNGSVHRMRFKKIWGGHEFTEEEQRILLSGREITFQCKGKDIKGHLQYCEYESKIYFRFCPDFAKDQYDPRPVYRDLRQGSTFALDLERESGIMAEYMRRHYYAGLRNSDGSPVSDYRRIVDIEEQRQGVDVTYTRNGQRYLIDEKAQMDYIYKEKPLPTFALELLNGSSGATGWFINDTLKTEYYMCIWPHAEQRPLSVENIEYVHYALISKKKLRDTVEARCGRNAKQLLECAKRMVRDRMGEAVSGNSGACVGYRYQEDGFDDQCYLYYTLHKQEKPVNLVVRRSLLEETAEEYGTIGR